jgi:hypothetical protein
VKSDSSQKNLSAKARLFLCHILRDSRRTLCSDHMGVPVRMDRHRLDIFRTRSLHGVFQQDYGQGPRTINWHRGRFSEKTPTQTLFFFVNYYRSRHSLSLLPSTIIIDYSIGRISRSPKMSAYCPSFAGQPRLIDAIMSYVLPVAACQDYEVKDVNLSVSVQVHARTPAEVARLRTEMLSQEQRIK